MSRYTLKELQTREELDAVVDVIFKAQYSPYMPSSSIFFPVSGYSLEDRAAGIAASQERLWKEHLAADPATNHWIIVKENASSKIVGGCLWKWHDGNPFPDGIPKPNVYWWPEGEAKEFCEEMIRQSMTPRSLWMHGKNAEGFIEANELGRRLYEKWGYRVVMKLDLFIPSNKSDLWNKLAHELKMPPWYAMWRPLGGVTKDGQRNRPWQPL
ncbi:predicted protein [Sclerotinia sclerotiorum 1980 UF-70]|uniref:N-acetyltransferase domain-containing protein n=1 Tax=Sclerotinia sclerotiorum (strain ATCC 18683 / 1980 / Ss-1) TaxID=665079 RepID=A7EZY7_SCLS1|nr:predicted protein [Sclerotinia sclerotiorum 1980 UF-70]EDN95029.1 predicted protein [Sclerotinia sclerotiorum 1980 UF-70]